MALKKRPVRPCTVFPGIKGGGLGAQVRATARGGGAAIPKARGALQGRGSHARMSLCLQAWSRAWRTVGAQEGFAEHWVSDMLPKGLLKRVPSAA